MKSFSAREYLMIDIANSYGKDKETWEDRLTWFYTHEEVLEYLAHEADNEFAYAKARA